MRRRGTPRSVLHLAVGRLGVSSARSVDVIGSAHGPTAVFVARRPKWERGHIEVRPVLSAVLSALRMVSTYALILCVALAACNHLLSPRAGTNRKW